MDHQHQHPQGEYQAQFQHGPTPALGPPPKIRTPPAVLAPLFSIAREFRGLLAVPLAFFGGLIGSVILCGALVFTMWWLEEHAEARPPVEDDFTIDFEPGALTKLGVEPQEIPEKSITEDARTPEDVKTETVTEDETPPPEPEKEKEPEEEKPKDKTPINKDKKAPVKDKNQTKNNPYEKDLPNNVPESGDPFGDPNGWADLAKDGDPWATSVMAALNGMKVPAWAAKLPAGAPYRFRMRVCKNGTVDLVLDRGSSGNKELDAAIKGEIQRLKFNPPPAKIANKMKSNCVTLNYNFSWSAGRVK